jgi:hypothetical protein
LDGIRLYGVSAFSGYSTSAYPASLGQIPNGGAGLGADVNYGATASLGWQYHRDRSDFSLLYSGTYAGMARYSDTNAYNQFLALSASRKLSAKWVVTLSGTGSDSTIIESLYQPSTVGLATQTPATFDDLAAAFSIGQFSSSQVASTLTGAPQLESPARSLLLGDRILSYSGQASLTYVHSARLSFHVGSFAAGGQRRAGSQYEQNYEIPRSMGINAGVGMSYQLTPRTQVGLDVASNRISNLYQTGYVTTATASIGRKMGMHWFLRLDAGGSMDQTITQSHGTPRAKEVIGGGSIGFRTYQNTLVGSYTRSSTDTYGFAIGTTTTTSAGWTRHRPGSRWSMFASFGQQQIRNTGYTSLSGWQTSGGLSQSLNSRMQMTEQYVYLSNSGQYMGNNTNLAIHSVRVSVSWAPQALAH